MEKIILYWYNLSVAGLGRLAVNLVNLEVFPRELSDWPGPRGGLFREIGQPRGGFATSTCGYYGAHPWYLAPTRLARWLAATAFVCLQLASSVLHTSQYTTRYSVCFTSLGGFLHHIS